MNQRQPNDVEPTTPQIEDLMEDEEVSVLDETSVPDDVKDEVLQNVQRRHDRDDEIARADAPPSEIL